jgi:hypothetical protein
VPVGVGCLGMSGRSCPLRRSCRVGVSSLVHGAPVRRPRPPWLPQPVVELSGGRWSSLRSGRTCSPTSPRRIWFIEVGIPAVHEALSGTGGRGAGRHAYGREVGAHRMVDCLTPGTSCRGGTNQPSKSPGTGEEGGGRGARDSVRALPRYLPYPGNVRPRVSTMAGRPAAAGGVVGEYQAPTWTGPGTWRRPGRSSCGGTGAFDKSYAGSAPTGHQFDLVADSPRSSRSCNPAREGAPVGYQPREPRPSVHDGHPPSWPLCHLLAVGEPVDVEAPVPRPRGVLRGFRREARQRRSLERDDEPLSL